MQPDPLLQLGHSVMNITQCKRSQPNRSQHSTTPDGLRVTKKEWVTSEAALTWSVQLVWAHPLQGILLLPQVIHTLVSNGGERALHQRALTWHLPHTQTGIYRCAYMYALHVHQHIMQTAHCMSTNTLQPRERPMQTRSTNNCEKHIYSTIYTSRDTPTDTLRNTH